MPAGDVGAPVAMAGLRLASVRLLHACLRFNFAGTPPEDNAVYMVGLKRGATVYVCAGVGALK